MPKHISIRAVLLLSACAANASAADPKPVSIDTRACLPELRARAADQDLPASRFDALLAGVEPDASVLELLNAQPEFVTPIWDYLAVLVDEERVTDGRARLTENAELLARIEAEYGVDAASVVAVWGVESNYGQDLGGRPLLNSLLALSCAGRRQGFFRGELLALLRLLDTGDLVQKSGAPLVGSWAGAFGQTQFMPSTYQRVAVDFDGDGRRDLITSTADALASTARYLQLSRWRSGEPWGFEVKLPPGYTSGAGRKATESISTWSARGLLRADGSALAGGDAPAERSAGLLLPAGREGPAFLVFRNFEAFYSYNAAESYALAIAHLADRLRGGESFVGAWPTPDPGLSRAQRRELQSLLIARGHDIGEIDGRLGARSREAIKAEQSRLGWEADGRAGQKLLAALSEAQNP
jgi:glucose-6-phosphate 1-epimerase